MTSRHPDLDDLELLLQVAKSGSIGRAAAERGLSQPTVSRRMSSLEGSLRVPLLARSRTGSTLTPTGRLIVDWASRLLAYSDDFTRSVGTLRDVRAATVRAAVSMTIAEHYAPIWLARLHARAPELDVALIVRNSAEVADCVESGQADVGFIESPTVRRTVRRQRFGWDSLAIAVAPEHPWADGPRTVSAQVLAAAKPLVREPGSGTRVTLEGALQRKGLALVPRIEMASNTALKAAAVAGMGAVVLSDVALAQEFSDGRLVQIEVPDLPLRRPLSVIWRHGEELSAGAVTLLQVAAEPLAPQTRATQTRTT
jgi:DNA-binding transcriptional LysR family regulator